MNNHRFYIAFFLLSLLFVCVLSPAAARPAWVDKKPDDTSETVYFRAIGEAESGSEAEKAAIQNLHAVAAGTVMVGVRTSVREKSQTIQRGANGAIDELYIGEFDSEIASYTGMLLSGVKAESYSEAYNGTSGQRFRGWALGEVSRKKLEEEIAEFPKRISGQYSRLISDGGSLAADVRNRQSIMQTLEQNPLHKDAAWLDLPEGRVNLYDYLSSQINSWAGSIVFAPIPGQKVRKGETLNMPLAVSSSLYKSLGQFEYRINLSRLNSGTPAIVYNITAIDTSVLPIGVYKGSAELRLSALSPALRDITREFSLEVTLPAPPAKPFSPGPFGGLWSGAVVYSAQGQSYKDGYTLSIYADGTCWVAVAAQDGAVQTAACYWSVEEELFRLECDFENPAIARLPSLRWVAVYDMKNSSRELRLNIKPAPDYSGVVRLTLNKGR